MKKEMEHRCFFNGSFDILNVGHIRAIRHAQSLGQLVLGVNSDELMAWFKREPIIPFVQRAEMLGALLREEDILVETHEPAAINYLVRYDCDTYMLTEEWKDAQRPALAYIESIDGRVVYSPRYPDIYDCTTIRKRVYDTVRREQGGDK
jgi:choline-phosphate cytidylyltransferase/glycerol-3-phosphate cytidylyltransferase